MTDEAGDRVLTGDEVVARLLAAGCVAAAAEADELTAAAAGGVPEAWVRRRETGEPLAWITGSVVFAGRRLAAGPGVYVPRPQTEALAERAVACLPPGGRAVDLCTGIGAVAATLAAADPTASVVGVALDERAVRLARRNGVPAVCGDLATPLRATGTVDVVTAVAPYVPTAELALLPSDVRDHEPRAALDGGPDGLTLVRRVVTAAAGLLRPGGWLLVELGGDQDRLLAADLAAVGFDEPASWADEEGDRRGLVARLR